MSLPQTHPISLIHKEQYVQRKGKPYEPQGAIQTGVVLNSFLFYFVTDWKRTSNKYKLQTTLASRNAPLKKSAITNLIVKRIKNK